MANAVIDDKEALYAFLAAQPLCKWQATKQKEIAMGIHRERGTDGIHHAARNPAKDDNAELAAALSSMA